MTSQGDLGGEVLALPLGPFNSWDCGVACWRFLTQVLLWHTWRGKVAPVPGLPQDWPGEAVERHSCHHLPFSKEHVLCPGAGHTLRCTRDLYCQVSIVILPPALVPPSVKRDW